MDKSHILLERDDFRNGVFARDRNLCVLCGAAAQDAHHILERRLFPDGGYYLANGASVCGDCHIKCEQTTVSVEEIRTAAKIDKPILPPHLYRDQQYDKWGNIVLPNGQRMAGDLFYDESVQKILGQGGVLHLFTQYVKYPRTHHLPWSENLTEDDRVMSSLSEFVNCEVVVTEKMDGENTTMYNDHIHARSVDSGSHVSRNWVKNFWSGFAHDIPAGWRICGENLYAVHSIKYTTLPSFFMGFSIWNNKNTCLAWDETIEWFELLGITPVPVIYRGEWDEKLIRNIKVNKINQEGYVVRVASAFGYGDFRTHVGKYVRKDHVQTVKHWMHGQPVVVNGVI